MKSIPILAGLLLLTGCSKQPQVEVWVHNPSLIARTDEMIGIPLSGLAERKLSAPFTVTDEKGNHLPWQVTYDSLLIFPVSMRAGEEVTYTVTATATTDSIFTSVCGRVYPERLDDLAWENDKAAYRAYGPALQAKGEKAYGYDIFTKSVSIPVLEERYRRELDTEAWEQINRWRAEGKNMEADSLTRAISYHVDHGNGMDCYSVGPTLGGGTAALMENGELVYPYCYRTCEIMDNGPLRFTARLTFAPVAVGKDTAVVEQRTISLDKGSYLNRTDIIYEHLSVETPLAAGIVIHPQHPDGYAFDAETGYIAYADSTDNPRNDNGVIYIGSVFAAPLAEACVLPFDARRQKETGATGHVLGISTYLPHTTFTYYWGSGWSKAGVKDMDAWTEYLKLFAAKISQPLETEIR